MPISPMWIHMYGTEEKATRFLKQKIFIAGFGAEGQACYFRVCSKWESHRESETQDNSEVHSY